MTLTLFTAWTGTGTFADPHRPDLPAGTAYSIAGPADTAARAVPVTVTAGDQDQLAAIIDHANAALAAVPVVA